MTPALHRFPPASVAEVIRELERELELRRRLYPRWTAAGKMKGWEADRRIELCEFAIEMLRDLASEIENGGR